MKYPVFPLGLFLSVILTLGTYAQNDFTIEEILGSSFPSGLICSDNGDYSSWVENHKGIRNIFTFDGNRTRQITDYSEDDGQEISGLVFSPDNSFMIFIRGGAPNRSGEIPNPLSWPDRANKQIWKIDINGKNLELISDGSSPSLSNNGKILAFIKGGQTWKTELDSDKDPEPFFSIRGNAGSLSWSPDDSKLAFQSSRGDHSFIGIYDINKQVIGYVSPSVDHDFEPVWSPDGKHLAFIRVPNESQILPFTPQRTALPWSIRIADSESGISSEIWKANEGRGSAFRGISAASQLFWAADDRIVFPWEGKGWTHLYSIESNGSSLELLTPGHSEVQFVSISPDRKTIVYSGNEGDINRQHVWKIDVISGQNKQITRGKGLEWSPMINKSNKIFCLASGPKTPAYAAILEKGSIREIRSKSYNSNFPTKGLVIPEQVVFSASDGMKIHGQLFLPPNMKEGEKYPAILFFHGGSRRQMLLGFHHRGYYHNAYSLNQFLANNGYIVLSVNYRSGIGYGMIFREALNYGARGASEFQDVLGAGLYLRGRSDVDGERIGLWGGSYGGFLTAMGLAKASDLFAAGVDLHGVHDWNVVIGNFSSGYDPAKSEEASRLAFESSPMAYVDGWRSPVLLIHGDDDRNVPFSETVDLVESLRRNDVYFEQLIFPDEVHGFLLHSSWVKAYKATFDFFERKLKDN